MTDAAAGFPPWFDSVARGNFEAILLPEFADGRPLDLLQIGAFTGDATVWLAENLLTAPARTLTDVDPWTVEENEAGLEDDWDWVDVERIYSDRVAALADPSRVRTYKGTSNDYFRELPADTQFDFVYVDGDHHAPSTLEDGLNAFRTTRPGGIIAFDDYLWNQEAPAHMRPQASIDALLTVFADRVEILHHFYQVWIRKCR